MVSLPRQALLFYKCRHKNIILYSKDKNITISNVNRIKNYTNLCTSSTNLCISHTTGVDLT